MVGKTQFFIDSWRRLTSDKWVLDTVSGYRIVFDKQPIQKRVPLEIPFISEQRKIVEEEIKTLIDIGAIVETIHEPNEFISTLFIVPKPNGKYRPVINLKFLNEFVQYNHFKQETFKVVLDLLQKDDFLTSVDMEQAYFHIPIHAESQKFLKFYWNGHLYKFVCLCFGLASAPYVFTKVLKPVFSYFRQIGIRCSYYIDDSLTMNKDKETCKNNTDTVVHILTSLGFSINDKKSVLVPTQRIVFFGFVIDTVLFRVFLTEEKLEKIRKQAEKLLKTKLVVVRHLASFIGLLVNAFNAVLEAPLHYRSLERDKLTGLCSDSNFDNSIQLSISSRNDIIWWLNNVRDKNGKSIKPKLISCHCKTDASLQGWGGVNTQNNKYANGRWTTNEMQLSINILELMAIFNVLQSLYSDYCNEHIEIQSDNVTAIKYINDMGGMTCSVMDSIARDVWYWCIKRDIFITAVHIPGVKNVEADFYSRNFSDSSEWMLKKQVFERICCQFFTPLIDLFASRLNKQTELFVSWFQEPGAIFANAFHMSWHDTKPYIFPPFSLVGKVICKIKEDAVDRAIVIFPLWRTQPWFPCLMEIISDFPVRLPRHRDILTLPHNGQVHPLSKRLDLVAAVVSGRPSVVEDFHQRLQPSSWLPGEEELSNSMILHGGSGCLGVCAGKLLPLTHLK